jgi:hypothetical protein
MVDIDCTNISHQQYEEGVIGDLINPSFLIATSSSDTSLLDHITRDIDEGPS